MASELRQRFFSERQILANLDHPNIARLLDGGTTADGISYVVMEFIAGQAIDAYCKGLNLPQKIILMVQVARAVDYAHRHLVVHRDLKPDNIYVTSDGIPKLLDFGIAKALDPKAAGVDIRLTLDAARLMTPEYASPEQVRGEAITTATDVYQIGVLLYLLLTGRRPFPADTKKKLGELERLICDVPPPRPNIDRDLDQIILHALEKDPKRRYSSARELADDLERYQNGFPVNARASRLYRTQKFVSRNKLVVGTDLEGAQTMVGQLQSKRQALTKDINDLATAKHKLANVDSSGEGYRTEELLAEAQEKREAAQRYEDKEKHEISALELTEKRLVEMENEVNRRSELQTQIAEVGERVAAAAAAESEAAQALGNATEALNRQRDRVRIVKVACDEAGQALRRARSLHDLALSAQSIVGFERRLELAEAAQNHANDLAAQLLSFTVTEPGLQAARSIDARLRQVRSTLEAQASHVTLDLSSAGGGRIRVNGAPMSDSFLTVIEDVVIDIEDVGTIRIESGIKDRDAQLAKRVEEERLLRSALATMAVGTLQQTEQQFAARQRCEQELTDARREVARLTPADPPQKIPAGLEALRNHIAVLRVALGNSLASAKLEAPPEAEITRQELNAAVLRDVELSQTINIEQAPLSELEQQQLNAVRMHTQLVMLILLVRCNLKCSRMQISQFFPQIISHSQRKNSNILIRCQRSLGERSFMP